MIGNILDPAQSGHGVLQIPRVPENDSGHEKVETGDAMLLVFVGTVADFAQPMDEDRAGKAVARLTLVEFLACCTPQLGVVDPTNVNSVRSNRPSSRNAAATPFCRGYEASWRMISEAVTVPVRMEATMRRISNQ